MDVRCMYRNNILTIRFADSKQGKAELSGMVDRKLCDKIIEYVNGSGSQVDMSDESALARLGMLLKYNEHFQKKLIKLSSTDPISVVNMIGKKNAGLFGIIVNPNKWPEIGLTLNYAPLPDGSCKVEWIKFTGFGALYREINKFVSPYLNSYSDVRKVDDDTEVLKEFENENV